MGTLIIDSGSSVMPSPISNTYGSFIGVSVTGPINQGNGLYRLTVTWTGYSHKNDYDGFTLYDHDFISLPVQLFRTQVLS